MWYVTVVCGRQGSGQRFANTPGSIRLFYQDVTHSLESIVSLPIRSQEIALWVAICMHACSVQSWQSICYNDTKSPLEM